VNNISGANVTYAAGGNGAIANAGKGADASPNTGNGGGGSSNNGTVWSGGGGGSGIIIIRFAAADWVGYEIEGGTVTTDGGDVIHTFTSSGLFEVFQGARWFPSLPDYVLDTKVEVVNY
jgi:hypothetical protein